MGGVDIGLSTSRAEDIKAYLKVYDTFAEEWWNLALKKRELQYVFGTKELLGCTTLISLMWSQQGGETSPDCERGRPWSGS